MKALLGQRWIQGEGFETGTYLQLYATRQAAVGRAIRARNALNRSGIEGYCVTYWVERTPEGWMLHASVEACS